MEKNYQQLTHDIKKFAKELGFSDVGIAHPNLSAYEKPYFQWIEKGFHGEMDYMIAHGTKRTRPAELLPGTQAIISVRYPYFDPAGHSPIAQLHQSSHAYVSRYALGRDYHKLMRKKLQQLAQFIQRQEPDLQARAFCDSAPVLERPLAKEAGLGFIGKNSLVIHPRAGSWFFLGELFVNLPLPADPPYENQGCGPCTACITECPTQAIIEDGIVDARRCISYLTIEHPGEIDKALRPLMGNRIYGCDDCQLVCPWNRFTEPTQDKAFAPRHQLDKASLLELWEWNEAEFLKRLEGSPIRRIGFERWQRNLAVAIGNFQGSVAEMDRHIEALRLKLSTATPLVVTHIRWAIQSLEKRKENTNKAGEEKTNAKIPSPASHETVQRPDRTGNSEQTALKNLKPFKAKRYYLPTAIPKRARFNRLESDRDKS
jgi:epoxyqueuosine reductase